jgi:Fe-S cluster biosynthesis and repair protein YggX
LREELQSRICRDCWAEWLKVEVMVINELQLNFMEPKALDILVGHMREFLCLDHVAESGE